MRRVARAGAVLGGLGLAMLVGCASRVPASPVATNATAAAVDLTVRVVGAASEEGWIAVAVYGSPESFADRRDPVAAARLAIAGGAASWRSPSLPPGRYAVAAYHDADGDGELDRSAVGVPTEPYGFSNDARGRFGPPSFDDAVVELGGGATGLEINLR